MHIQISLRHQSRMTRHSLPSRIGWWALLVYQGVCHMATTQGVRERSTYVYDRIGCDWIWCDVIAYDVVL